ncbi:hypothetical protein IW262DRAFT_1069977 [Armillaria fumosa]|nr:hypothetical protein IW262DRAFT_1069977 [Armillaria fumosa]
MTCRLLHQSLLHRCTPTPPPFIQHRSFSAQFRPVQMLNPKNLTEDDFRDISGRETASPLVGRFYHLKEGVYPKQTTGFYYYWIHPDLAATAGQLRFRLTPSNDPSLFTSGSDLLEPNGLPWTVSVPRLCGLQKFHYANMLLEDGPVTKDLVGEDVSCRSADEQDRE